MESKQNVIFLPRAVDRHYIATRSSSPGPLSYSIVPEHRATGEVSNNGTHTSKVRICIIYPARCEKSVRGIPLLCCSTIVIMKHATQDVEPLDRTIPRRTCHERHRTTLIDALMRSSIVVISNIRRQNSVQVTLVEDQDSVEAFLTN
jgi:hypothetical protein